jgi:hypothetical protein
MAVLGTEARPGLAIALKHVGIGGVALYLIVAGLGSWQAWLQFKKTRDEGYRFLIAQIVLAVLSSLANSQYLQPSLCVGLCLAGLASLELTPIQIRSALTGVTGKKKTSAVLGPTDQLSLSGG